MKTKIKGKMYEVKIIPREFTAVMFTDKEPIEDTDNAFMIFNCPVPTSKKELDEIKKKAVAKAEECYEDFERYLQCNIYLHEEDKCKKS